ncbi:polysaccharide biosynthesis protein [Pseudonocardia humida]|uniref:Polysaccharide biosynthesis protein n=1 Tax=Pseudonocardia humida TaxID=2800819 RepID=A0ABT0ZT34_9PSEU|nr:polysaccharide biosynthesis protein [Pseudonocardia humida]MCO1653884.1 polysaccharide biosynthesis protein [Pseudonocardia humida]
METYVEQGSPGAAVRTAGSPDRAGVRRLPRRARRLALLAWDSAAWVIGLSTGVWLRYDGDVTAIDTRGLAQVLVVALVVQVIVAVPLRLYRGRYSTGSVEDAISVTAAVALVGIVAFVVVLLPSLPPVPRSVPAAGALIALLLSVGARVVVRRWRDRSVRSDGPPTHRVIVLGAGLEGQQLVRSMIADRGREYLPVALLDDDPDLRRRRVYGVRVRGTRDDIAEVAAATGADLLVVASSVLDATAVHRVNRAATTAGLGVKVLPPMAELLGSEIGLAQLRDLDITDLLGRQPVEVDVAAIAGYLTGRRVLVTGAGGSIGSELCRQIHRFGPAELMMLDRDESALHAIQLSIHGSALLDSPDVILADIRDAAVLTALFVARRPEVIFHAAALKHLPLLEQYPTEAWKTNVIGTQNVLDAARACRAEKFVNISTDKAANPISVLGRSKRIGERLVADAACRATGTYLSVRFGNVLGSRGSMLGTFTEQLAHGGPITVTHPEVTRFFMTIPEAVQLVVHAAAIGAPGEVLVLDMGKAVRIEDVARQLMEIAGRTVQIVYTGLRRGEKLHEELFGDEESSTCQVHRAVSHVTVPTLGITFVRQHGDRVGAERAMVELPQFPDSSWTGETAMLAPLLALRRA